MQRTRICLQGLTIWTEMQNTYRYARKSFDFFSAAGSVGFLLEISRASRLADFLRLAFYLARCGGRDFRDRGDHVHGLRARSSRLSALIRPRCMIATEHPALRAL